MDTFLLASIALILMVVAVYRLALEGAESDDLREDDWLAARHTIPGPPKVCPDCRHLVRQCCDSILGDDHMQACQWRDGLPRYWVDTPAGRYWQEFHARDERAVAWRHPRLGVAELRESGPLPPEPAKPEAAAQNAATAAEAWSDREDAA